jgi:hypothetical protein
LLKIIENDEKKFLRVPYIITGANARSLNAEKYTGKKWSDSINK